MILNLTTTDPLAATEYLREITAEGRFGVNGRILNLLGDSPLQPEDALDRLMWLSAAAAGKDRPPAASADRLLREYLVMERLIRNDPELAYSHAKQLREQIYEGDAMELLVSLWARIDPEAAIRAVLRFSGQLELQPSTVEQMLEAILSEPGTAFRTDVLNSSVYADQPEVIRACLRVSARLDGPEACSIALNQETVGASDTRSRLVYAQLVLESPRSAYEWLLTAAPNWYAVSGEDFINIISDTWEHDPEHFFDKADRERWIEEALTLPFAKTTEIYEWQESVMAIVLGQIEGDGFSIPSLADKYAAAFSPWLASFGVKYHGSLKDSLEEFYKIYNERGLHSMQSKDTDK